MELKKILEQSNKIYEENKKAEAQKVLDKINADNEALKKIREVAISRIIPKLEEMILQNVERGFAVVADERYLYKDNLWSIPIDDMSELVNSIAFDSSKYTDSPFLYKNDKRIIGKKANQEDGIKVNYFYIFEIVELIEIIQDFLKENNIALYQLAYYNTDYWERGEINRAKYKDNKLIISWRFFSVEDFYRNVKRITTLYSYSGTLYFPYISSGVIDNASIGVDMARIIDGKRKEFNFEIEYAEKEKRNKLWAEEREFEEKRKNLRLAEQYPDDVIDKIKQKRGWM